MTNNDHSSISSSASSVSTSIIIVSSVLMAIGLVMVTSATAPLDRSAIGDNIWQSVYARQAVFVVLAVMVMALVARYGSLFWDSNFWRLRLPPALFLLVLVGLVGALFLGSTGRHNTSARWLRFGLAGFSLGIQPSELAKPAVVIFIAWLVAVRRCDPRSFLRFFLPACAALGLMVALVGVEDLGTALSVAVVGALMLVVVGSRYSHLLLAGVIGAALLVGLLLAAPYRMTRVTSFLDVWGQSQGAGYQPVQSLAAIASGDWLGTGLGAGIQKFGYLPESHSDFIFATICEEAGIIGGWAVIALFCWMLWLGWQTIRRAGTPFEQLIAFGIVVTLGAQAVMNIAVVTVVTPTTGISLPFVSAGGSGLLTFGFTIGLLANVARRASASDADQGLLAVNPSKFSIFSDQGAARTGGGGW